MRRVIFGLWLTVLIGCFFQLGSAKEKPKTGVLTETSFTDSAFGYSTSIPPNWKAKIKAEPSLVRLILEKSEEQIDIRFSAERSNAGTRPRFLILADTTSLGVEDFLKRLFGDGSLKKRGNI